MATLLVSQRNFESHETPAGHPERPDRIRAIEEALRPELFPASVAQGCAVGRPDARRTRA